MTKKAIWFAIYILSMTFNGIMIGSSYGVFSWQYFVALLCGCLCYIAGAEIFGNW